MKYQSYYPYPLQVDFESPLWDFTKKDGNEKIVGDLMVKRMQNGLRYKRMNNGKMESFISETLMAIRYGLPPEKKDDGIYVSGLYLVVSRIIEVLVTRMKDCGGGEAALQHFHRKKALISI